MQCTGTVIVIIGFTVIGPAPYLGMEANYSLVCVGLTVCKCQSVGQDEI